MKLPREAIGSCWGPPGRSLRLAIEHLAQHRGGICFCVDLDPRWVIKLLKDRKFDEANRYKGALHRPGADHPGGGHNTSAVHTAEVAAALDEALRAGRLEDMRRKSDIRSGGQPAQHSRHGHTGIFSGAPNSPQSSPARRWRKCWKPRLHDADLRQHAHGPRCSKPVGPHRWLQDQLLRPPAAGRHPGREPPTITTNWLIRSDWPRAVDHVDQRVLMPLFPERDEGERETAVREIPLGRRQRRAALQPTGGRNTVGVY